MRLSVSAETLGPFETEDHAKECAVNALREAIDRIEDGWTGGPVHDVHGNVAGNFLFLTRQPGESDGPVNETEKGGPPRPRGQTPTR